MDIPGIDIHGCLERFPGNWKSYKRLLTQFVTATEDFPKKLDQAIKENYLSKVKFEVHTLKGVAENLGMTGLFELLQELDIQVSSSGKFPPELLASVKEEYFQIRKTLREHLVLEPGI